MADAAELAILVRAKDQASQMLGKLNTTLKENQEQLKKVGEAAQRVGTQMRDMGVKASVAGAAITAALTLAAKSVIEEEQGVARLTVLLRNMGVEYAAVRDEIESTIIAIQRKTSYGDEEQRRVLANLILVTGDYKMALQALPAVLDAAAFAAESPISMSERLGRALMGQVNQLPKLGLEFEKEAGFADRLTHVLDQLGGTAEALADPFTQLKNEIGDTIQEAIRPLVPEIKAIIGSIKDVVIKVGEWAAEHPGLTKAILGIIGAVGAFLVVMGPIIMIVGQLIASLGGLLIMLGGVGGAAGFGALLAPIGAAIAAILPFIPIVLGVIAALGVLGLAVHAVVTHWEGIVSFFKTVGRGIKEAFIEIANFILAPIRGAVNGAIEFINMLIRALNKIPFVNLKEIGWRMPELKIGAPEMQYGGVVPGPVGRPVPIIAHGGEVFAGVGGRMPMAAPVTITNEYEIKTLAFTGDKASLRALAREIMEMQRQEHRRTTGVSM